MAVYWVVQWAALWGIVSAAGSVLSEQQSQQLGHG